MDIKEMAFIAGLILGSLVIMSVCWVWVRNQVLGIGGGILSFFGVLLVGLSVWSSASVEVSADGFSARLDKLQNEVQVVVRNNQEISEDIKLVADTNQLISRQVKVAANSIEINKAQFLQLTSALNNKQVFNQTQMRTLSSPIINAPKIDIRALDAAILKSDLQRQSTLR